MTAKRTTKSLGIVELLELRGFDPSRPTKLVRHQSTEYDVLEWEQRYKEKLGSRATGLNVY